jgi:lipopolysaccharide export system permease protein
MQFLWKYIDDLVGKGLEWYVISELLFYASATLVPLALPLAILVSSIMTMGTLAENYELVAAKSAGISLLRILQPMLLTAMLVSVMAFYFSNYVLPYTNLKMGSLLYDVRQQKPALYIREGVFYNGIEGYSLKIGKKESDNQTLRNVMIYDHTSQRGNTKVIVAESGKMAMSDDEKYLVVTLFDGQSYEDQHQNKSKSASSNPFLRTSFDSYQIRFDLSTFKLSRTNEDLFKDNYQMLNLHQLKFALDSLNLQLVKRRAESTHSLKTYFTTYRDSSLYKAVATSPAMEAIDTVSSPAIYDNALGQARNVKSYLTSLADEKDAREKLIARFAIEYHRKYTLSIACFILFIIGAPLGAIIRKGGIGMPVVVSIIFFLFFHVISIMGEKFSREGVIEPVFGMWVASSVLLPIGLFLLYKATRDSALFDLEVYGKFFKNILRKGQK